MIKSFDYKSTLKEIFPEILKAIEKVLLSGQLLLGPETEAFEREFSEFVGAKYCVGVTSGTAAIYVALMALDIGEGDEVITISNTCVPTIAAIEMVGAIPIFVDVNDNDLMINPKLIKKAISPKTKAIIPVHLWGQAVDIDSLIEIARKNNLKIVEDCAQATGTIYKNKHVGTFGDLGAFSFYPTKNLGAYGDAGAVITNNYDLAEKLKKLRMYGYNEHNISVLKGTNARISEIQSAILRVKLKYLSQWLKRKREIAYFYFKKIKNKKIILPYIYRDRKYSFHQFVIRTDNRDLLLKKIRENMIEYGIHYPVPIHLMPYFKRKYKKFYNLPITEKSAKEILSIPVHEALKDEEIEKITDVINRF